MAAAWYRTRAELRRSWRGAVALTLLIALVGGGVLATAAGARRTASAYPRMREAHHAAELLASPPLEEPGADPQPFYDAIAELDGVARVVRGSVVNAAPRAGSSIDLELLVWFGPNDDAAFTSVEQPLLLDGRVPDPSRADEVLVSHAASEELGVAVGDRIDAIILPNAVENAVSAEPDDGRPVQVTVVGVGLFPDEVVPLTDLDAAGTIISTPAFMAELAPEERSTTEGAFIDLEDEDDHEAIAQQVSDLGASMPEAIGGAEVFIQDYAAQAPLVQDSLTPLAVALGLFSLVLGVAGLLVIGQAVTRHTRLDLEDETTLAAMGFSRGQRVALPILRSVPIALAGAAGAAAVAYLLSPRFPIGLARLAEPDRGFDVDPLAFTIGVPAVAALTVLAVVPGALRRFRLRDAAEPAPRRAWAARWTRLPLVPSEGIRFAFDSGSGATRVPVRSGIVAAALAVAALLAATTFAASLDGFVSDPSRYGQHWDRLVDQQFGPVPVVPLLDQLEPVDSVTGVAGGVYGETDIEGERIPAIGWQPLRGDVSLTVVEGRMASAADEVALGGEILDRLDLSVGDTVGVDGGEGPVPRRIVGEAIFPRLGLGSFAATGLGVGAQLSPDGLVGTSLPSAEELAMFVEEPALFSLDGRSFNFLAVAAPDDPEAVDAAIQPLIDDGLLLASRIDQRPTRVTDLTRVQEIPSVLALVFAALAAAVLAHVLVSSVRQRRSDLAVLRTLGFQRSQLRGTVAWQASAIAVSALVVGIPVGIAAGRFAWDSFVDGLHVPALPDTPWAWILLVIPATVLVANAVAAVPAVMAARVRPAEALRRD